ncbi:MAG TPA: nitrite reductase (NAD(P)H) small subunit, partial [Gammaproteobacteria bacterium]|nr:nitrite reductase (NAD(P)H) small subunit [Gammaproteobacteria bacterium]
MQATTKASAQGNWVEVGKVDDIPQLGARVVNTPDGDIAIFRTAEDEIFALRDKCPH